MLREIQFDEVARAVRQPLVTDDSSLAADHSVADHRSLLRHLIWLAVSLQALTGCGLVHIPRSQPKAEIRQLHAPTNAVGGVITLNML